MNKYYFVEDGVVIEQTDLYEDAYLTQVMYLGDKYALKYDEIRDINNPDIIIRNFGHPTISLHYSDKYHNRRAYYNHGNR